MKNFKYCYNCGQKLPKVANYCVRCGTPQNFEFDDEVQTSTENTEFVQVPFIKPNKVSKFNVLNFISRITLLLLSIVMIVFTFLPTSVAYYKSEVLVEVNSYQSITLLFDSFQNKSEEELEESDIYYEINELTQNMDIHTFDDFRELSQNEKNDVKKIIFLTLRLTLQSEETFTPLDIILGACFSLIYVLFAIAFFIISLLNFLGFFIAKLDKLNTVNIVLLSFIPLVNLVTYFSNCGFLSDSFIVKMGSGTLLLLIFSVIVILYNIIISFIRKENKLKTKEIVFSSIKFALIIVAICLMFAPFFNSHIRTTFLGSDNEKEAIIYNDVFKFYNFEYSDKEIEEFEKWFNMNKDETAEYFNKLFAAFSGVKYTEINEGSGKLVNAAFLIFSFTNNGGYQFAFIFILVPVLCLLALGLLCLTVQQLILKFIFGKSSKFLLRFSSITQGILILLSFAITLAFIIYVQNYSINTYCRKEYELKIDVSLICLLISSLLVIFIPVNFKNREAVEELVLE